MPAYEHQGNMKRHCLARAELAEKVRRRALGAVLGAAVADAAAMGVQGVLDLSLLGRLAAERGADEQVRAMDGGYRESAIVMSRLLLTIDGWLS